MNKKIISSFFTLILLSLFISCLNKNPGPPAVWYRTDVKVNVYVKDSFSLQPYVGQEINYSFHKHNIHNGDDDFIRMSNAYTEESGIADVPIYDCMIAPSDAVIFSASIPEMDSAVVETSFVNYVMAREVAIEQADGTWFAYIEMDYLILK